MYYIKLVVVEMQDHFLGTLVQIQVPGFVSFNIFSKHPQEYKKSAAFIILTVVF